MAKLYLNLPFIDERISPSGRHKLSSLNAEARGAGGYDWYPAWRGSV